MQALNIKPESGSGTIPVASGARKPRVVAFHEHPDRELETAAALTEAREMLFP